MIDLLQEIKKWLQGLEIIKLVKACKAFWDDVEVWLQVPLKQRDIENCHPLALKIHGWGRRTERSPGEDIELYRKRVLNALQNLQSAGLTKGLKEILTRFGVQEYQIYERQPQLDPDIVTIELPQGGITDDQELLLKIFQEYGLTCRRYSQTVSETVEIWLPSTLLEHNQDTEVVTPNQNFFDEESINIWLSTACIEHNQDTETVSL